MSLDKVKTRVLEEAGARADKMLADARIKAGHILDEGKAAAERSGAEAARDARLRLERETIRELERIQHDNRLQILSAKNKAIDEVFRRVKDKLAALSDSDCLAMVGGWLDGLPAEVGGVLRVNPSDAAKFKSGLDALNRTRSGSGRFTEVISDPKVPNGAVVDGPDYNIDCTIDRRLNDLRETAAGDLARVLFGA